MSYLVQYSVARDKTALLDRIRPRHRAHVEAWEDQLQFTALTLDEDGKTLLSALFILRVETRDEAVRFSAGDPYVQVGIFETPQIARFLKRRDWSD